MKTSYSLSLALLAGLSPLSMFAETAGGITRIVEVNTPPVIDGSVDSVWYDGYSYPINVVQSGVVEDSADCSAVWRGLYTPDKLFLYVEITDQYLTSTEGSARWKQDLVEVYFNVDNLKPGGGGSSAGDNYQLAFNLDMPDGEFGGGNSASVWAGVEWVQVRTETGWVLEASVEWSALGVVNPVKGIDLGFDIAVVDNDGQPSNDSVIYWHNAQGALFPNIDGAGTIVLGDLAEEVIPKLATGPTIDATKDEIWNAVLGTAIEAVQVGKVDNAADCSAVWYGAYTDENFYFFIDITDNILTSTAGTAEYLQDRIEMFFDVDRVKPGGGNGHSGDNYQFAFNWNILKTAGTGIVWEFVTTNKGWALEGSIPWSTIGMSAPSAGDRIGFDIALNDNDGQSHYEGVLYWHNTATALFANIDGAGTIQFGDTFDGNYPPVFEPLADQVAVESVASNFTITATDLNASDSLTITAGTLPTAIGFVDNGDGTATIAVNALTEDVGVHQFPVTVSDGSLTDTKLVTVLIQAVGGASEPVITAIDPVSVVEGEQVLQNVFVTDLDSREISITTDLELPGFVTFLDSGDGTARFKFAPGAGDSGTYTLSVKATDESNHVDEITFDVTVTAQWRGLLVDDDLNVETPGILGWVHVAHDPWLYVYGLDAWLYVPENGDAESNWIYSVDLGF